MPAFTPVTTPPSQLQLARLATFAKLAWGEEVPIRFGYRLTKTGTCVYVKQARRGGNQITQEGSSTEGVLDSMEKLFIALASDTLTRAYGKPISEGYIRNVVDSLVVES
jgi:hypothetical protein